MAVLLVFWSAMASVEGERLIMSEGGYVPPGLAWQVAERVTRVEMVVQTSNPPHLLVRAVGVLPAGEYDRIELVRVHHGLEPSEPRDGMQVFRIVAVPAAGAKAAEPGAAPREVNVVHQWKNFGREAPWLRGVRVYAKAGSVEKRWTEPGQEGPLKAPGKERVSDRGSSGDHSQPGAQNQRMARVKRWKINLAYEDPKEFIKKLGELKVEVGARMSDGRFLIYADLASSPDKPKEMRIEEFQKHAQKMQRLWMVTHDRNTCENYQIGVGLNERPTTIFLFLPQDLEKAIVDAEIKHHDLTEKEIKEKKIVTKFDVTRKEKGWEVRVTGSYVDANLKYDK